MLTLFPRRPTKFIDPSEKLNTPEKTCLREGTAAGVHARTLLERKQKNRMENRDLKWKFIVGKLSEWSSWVLSTNTTFMSLYIFSTYNIAIIS